MMLNVRIFVLVLMILGHLLADYPLQGWLAQAKNKSYWNREDKKIKDDWIAALICHATMWGILMFLPIMLEDGVFLDWWWLLLPANIAIHAFIDHLKANKKAICLIDDQLLHLLQIAITWMLWVCFIN